MPSKKAIRLRQIIETAVQNLPEKDASEAVTLYPHLKGDGSLIRANTMVQYSGKVYRAGSDLWDRPENAPDKAPALWRELKYREGIRIIPDHISVTEAFAEGEKGWWKDEVWESIVNGNVYTPADYPQNWRKIK